MRPSPAFLVLSAVLAATPVAAAPPVRFNRDVRPILSENCFFCHGPDKAKRKGGLRLDDRAAALEDGAIVPGQPEASELWRRITSKDPEDVMPPMDTHKQITPAQLETLRRWIAEGAPYEAHWAYVPVARPPVPTPRDGAWPRTPVDAFVLATLEERGLAPSPAADRRTLLRRVSLDLTGLPPTPAEVAAFVADARPDAYERQVDRLLASPHFGERMAVPWLDVVRFADTVGYHGDQNQNVFPYRDWVIDAFNRNLPFDRFTIEQLAGDLLPRPTAAQLVATGFNRLNMVTREGGAQPKEYLAKYMADRVRAVGATWLGSTFGCAECHDHKYDPISMKDFYALGAFFADVKEWGVYQDYTYTPNSELKGWSNDHPFPPEITVRSPYLMARAARLRAEQKALAGEVARALAKDAAFAAWRREAARFLARHPDGFRPLRPAGAEADGTVLVTEDRPRLRAAAGAGWLAALRLELVPHPKNGGSIRRAGKGTPNPMVRLEAKLVRGGDERRLAFHFADARPRAPHFVNGHEVIGVTPGWKLSPEAERQRHLAVYELAEPLALEAGDELVVEVAGERLGAVRLSASPLAALSAPGAPSPLDGRRFGRAVTVRAIAPAVYLTSTGALPPQAARARELARDLRDTRGGAAATVITRATTPRPIRVLPRGNWQDDSGELVAPATPHFLPGAPRPTAA